MQVKLIGVLSGKTEYEGHCICSLEFETNGPQGGDAGHGGYLRIRLNNEASASIEVSADGLKKQRIDSSFEITFSGDDEIRMATELFSRMSKALEKLDL